MFYLSLILVTFNSWVNRLFEWLINHYWLDFKRNIDVSTIRLFDFSLKHQILIAAPLYVWVSVCYLRVYFNFTHPILSFLTVISFFLHPFCCSLTTFTAFFFYSLFPVYLLYFTHFLFYIRNRFALYIYIYILFNSQALQVST